MLIVDRRVRVLSEPECGGIGFLFHPEGRGRGSRKRWSASTEASMSEDGEPGVGRWKLQAGRAACCNRESSPLNISLHVCSVSRGSLPSRHRKITTTRKVVHPDLMCFQVPSSVCLYAHLLPRSSSANPPIPPVLLPTRRDRANAAKNIHVPS